MLLNDCILPSILQTCRFAAFGVFDNVMPDGIPTGAGRCQVDLQLWDLSRARSEPLVRGLVSKVSTPFKPGNRRVKPSGECDEESDRNCAAAPTARGSVCISSKKVAGATIYS